mmetsp:Transcript_87513/g.136987  ORF Transcript_87513/g.136987 Transcript_87513/m.136987 type:complete len:115 (+) Transcript_87513:107-451(+)
MHQGLRSLQWSYHSSHAPTTPLPGTSCVPELFRDMPSTHEKHPHDGGTLIVSSTCEQNFPLRIISAQYFSMLCTATCTPFSAQSLTATSFALATMERSLTTDAMASPNSDAVVF